MTYGTINVDKVVSSDGTTAGGLYGFKNRIINGAMVIDQRNAGASVTPSSSGTYTLDRWKTSFSQASKFSVQQNAASATPPSGFINYLGVTSASAYSVTSTDYFRTFQWVEGLNIADLGWGAAGAASVTLSFWVRSSLTGTFGGSIQNSAGNRSYPYSYIISAANTWEYKTVLIAGDTSGTWLTTNGAGMLVGFSLGAGSTVSGSAGSWAGADYVSATGATSVVGTNGATFYITGVQVEKGSTATSFDYRPYGTELVLCQRYYQRYGSGSNTYESFLFGAGDSTTEIHGVIQYYTPMRSAPTATFSTLTTGLGGNITISNFIVNLNGNGTGRFVATGTGVTQYRPYIIRADNSFSAYIGLSSEL